MDPKSSAVQPSNAVRGARIPSGRRGRLLLLVGVAVAAGAAVGGVVVWRSGDSPKVVSKAGPKLKSAPPVRVQLPGPAVDFGRGAQVCAAAQARLPAGDVRIAVACTMADYLRDRSAAIADLQKLPQSQAAVVFNLGVAQLWDGQLTQATASLMHTRRLDPYGFYGSIADNLLFAKQELQSYPPYFPPFSQPSDPLAKLRANARAHPADASAWLELAVALERTNRVQAIAAARRALADDPTGIDPRVALAVLAFDKDMPGTALQTLDSMASDEPTNAEIRFHLGLLLFWTRDFQDAAGQMRQVVASHPQPPYRQLAVVFERCLTSSSSCNSVLGGSG